jgi:hypothetical protein
VLTILRLEAQLAEAQAKIAELRASAEPASCSTFSTAVALPAS